MNSKKEQERAELHRMIWEIANDLRGSVDGWDFKQYVLGMMFYRFISENIVDTINTIQRKKNPSYKYEEETDENAEKARTLLVETKGFFILPSQLFCNVIKKYKDNYTTLNIVLDQIFKSIERSAIGNASEDDIKGLFDDIDVNSNKLGSTDEQKNSKLIRLMISIQDL
ncbi:restriction endonuclease, partial [Mycoplasmopsis agassizii]